MQALFAITRDSLSEFLARWYGPPDRTPTLPNAAVHLPPPLREWYVLTSRYSTPVTFQNTFPGPAEIEEKDGRIVFWVENQAVYEWGVDPDDDDPMVYERATAEGEPWHATGVQLSAFLLTVAVFEAIMSAPHHALREARSPAELNSALGALQPLPVPGPMLDGQLYANEHVLAFVASDGKPGETPTSWTYLAARDPKHLNP